MVRVARRCHEKAVRVPVDLAADIARADGLGEAAWLRARAADDFSLLRDALARNVDLRRQYAACFAGAAHPYDVLLDDFEPDLTVATVGPLFTKLREALVPLVAAAGNPETPRNGGVFLGPYPLADQDRAVRRVVGAMGFDPQSWRLDLAAHPFAQALALTDVRITTHFEERDFGVAFYGTLHEFGHGLYEEGVDPALDRSPLADPGSLGLHESQSRLWENVVGRSLPFCEWVLPVLRDELGAGALAGLDARAVYHGVNTVAPSLIRIYSDETTYNLHIVLRYELELAMFAGELEVADLPDAWNAKVQDMLGIEVPSDRDGVLQDIHWGAGLLGYFPTYALGNLASAQLWTVIQRDIPEIEDHIRAGEFAPLREWLREHVHRHGRRFTPNELMERVTGEQLRVEPLIAYLEAKLRDSGVLGA
jgi:carboxypeptidase Taq